MANAAMQELLMKRNVILAVESPHKNGKMSFPHFSYHSCTFLRIKLLKLQVSRSPCLVGTEREPIGDFRRIGWQSRVDLFGQEIHFLITQQTIN